MAKTKKQPSKHPLRLIRWAEDGYPPIDLSDEVPAIMELIREYQRISKNLEYAKESIKNLLS